MSLATLLWRSARLRCPRCGQGRMFRNWFAMNPACNHCGLEFARGPGYFLGSIYINYGLTALLITAFYFAGFFLNLLPPETLLWTCAAFCVLFPLWFFRYARSLWLGVDLYFDPPQESESVVKR